MTRTKLLFSLAGCTCALAVYTGSARAQKLTVKGPIFVGQAGQSAQIFHKDNAVPQNTILSANTDGTLQIAPNGRDKAGNGFDVVSIGANAPAIALLVHGTVVSTSDARYKTNVTTLEHVLSKVLALRAVRFDPVGQHDITPGHGRQVGFIAQELERSFPEVVYTDAHGYKAVAYDRLSALLVSALREQHEVTARELAELRRDVTALATAQAGSGGARLSTFAMPSFAALLLGLGIGLALRRARRVHV
jgi:hypothetical protein